MVERFNRTLVSMIGTFVNDHHSDGDEQIPYVLMAYRSSAHETTGLSPNLLMLGRERTMPLDIAFEMPPSIKQVPVNRWVWELRERLESAHTYIRQTTGESMRRQKKVRDRKQYSSLVKTYMLIFQSKRWVFQSKRWVIPPN